MRRRGRKLAFAAITLLFVWILVEAIAFVAYWALDGKPFGWARASAEISAAARGDEATPDLGPRQQATIPVVPHPYVGFVYPPTLNSPDFERYHLHPVNSYGFVDSKPPVRRRDAGRVVVGVLGASVAYWFSALGDHALAEELRKDPRFADKEIEIVRLAMGGMKQPQQLMTLEWILSLGGEFDVVLNVDGYNEAMIPEPENKAAGMHPHYPRLWNQLLQGAPTHEFLRLLGTVVRAKDDRRAWAAGFDGKWISKSILLAFVWKARDRALLGDVARAQDALNRYVPPKQPYAAVGPGAADYPGSLEREVVATWRRCSELIAQACAARGILYLHFLQPNQYVGKKPMGAEEKKVALAPDHPLLPMLRRVYASMIEAGADLRRAGVAFHDLTPIFDDVQDAVYNDNCCHMNKLGNEIMARHVAGAVLEASKTWTPPPPPEMSPGIAGSGEVIPAIELAEPRAAGQLAWTIRLTRGLGGATGQLCLTSAPVTNPLAAMKDPSALPSVALFRFRLDGEPDAPGAGTATVDVPYPSDAGSAPRTWYLRALVYDAGAKQGISVSNSLTLTLK